MANGIEEDMEAGIRIERLLGDIDNPWLYGVTVRVATR